MMEQYRLPFKKLDNIIKLTANDGAWSEINLLVRVNPSWQAGTENFIETTAGLIEGKEVDPDRLILRQGFIALLDQANLNGDIKAGNLLGNLLDLQRKAVGYKQLAHADFN